MTVSVTASASDVGCPVSRKLIELLEEARGTQPGGNPPHFGDRLDALEVEALESCAPGATLAMIRVAREAMDFAERIAVLPKRA